MTNRLYLLAVWMPETIVGCYWAFESQPTARLLATTIQDRNPLIISCCFGRG